MKPVKTKAEKRAELAEHVEAYLKSGGNVKNVPPGVSGNENNSNFYHLSGSGEPKQGRTSVMEEIKALESRKQAKKNAKKTLSLRPRKKLITDDFGEPVRWVWVEK